MDEQHQEHQDHEHWHDSACGHETVQRTGGHVDYMHDGHEHHEHDGHWDEHQSTDDSSSQAPAGSMA